LAKSGTGALNITFIINGFHSNGKGSEITIKNTREDITPTGLNLNDLPFIGMIVLALMSIIGFIILKSRKDKEYGKA
jgi:hypothetical protein